MRPLDGLTDADAPSRADAATAAYWLTHPSTPTRRKTFADLTAQ